MMQQLWKIVWQFLKKVNVELPYDQPGLYPRELKTYVHKNVYLTIKSSMIPNSQKREQISING